MRICGIDIKSNEAIIVILDKDTSGVSHLAHKVSKIALQNELLPDSLVLFQQAFGALLQETNIEKIISKSLSRGGAFQCGPAAFKVEALIQLSASGKCPFEFISGKKIQSETKKRPTTYPATLRKFQQEAYLVAFYG